VVVGGGRDRMPTGQRCPDAVPREPCSRHPMMGRLAIGAALGRHPSRRAPGSDCSTMCRFVFGPRNDRSGDEGLILANTADLVFVKSECSSNFEATSQRDAIVLQSVRQMARTKVAGTVPPLGDPTCTAGGAAGCSLVRHRFANVAAVSSHDVDTRPSAERLRFRRLQPQCEEESAAFL